MAKKGKALEQLVAKIQEILKDREDTSIESNVRLRDRDNVLREFDVLVRTTNQCMPSIIAFECKDFSTSKSKPSVDVTVVDGFNTKCLEFPEIKQKIIVSTTGFSENAKIKAKSFGIDLIALEDVSLDVDLYSGEAYSAKPSFEVQYIDCLIVNNGKIESRTLHSLEYVLTCGLKTETLYELFKRRVKSMTAEDYKPLVEKFNYKKKQPFKYRYLYTPNECQNIRLDAHNTYMLMQLQLNVIVNFELTKGHKDVQKQLQQGCKKIGVIEYNFNGKDSKMLIIKDEDRALCFVKTDKGLKRFEYD